MEMRRIQVYADADTKRRIELAAAKHNITVTAYCLEAIMRQMSEDEVLEQEQIQISVRATDEIVSAEVISQMRALRERIKARRGGRLITTDFVEQVRAERDEELCDGIAGLR